MNNVIQGKPGRWEEINGITIFVNSLNNKVILPSTLAGANLDELDMSTVMQPQQVDNTKIQLVQALMMANTVNYPRLSDYLNDLANIIKLGTEYKAEQEQFDKFNSFVHSYSPVEPRMRDFLHRYTQNNEQLIEQLKQAIMTTSQTVIKPKSPIPTEKRENPMNVAKFGIYRFPFLVQEKLFVDDVEEFESNPTSMELYWNTFQTMGKY